MGKGLKAVLISGVMAFALSACGVVSYHSTSTGEAITKTQLGAITKGMNKNDVLIKLGDPTNVKVLGSEKVWFYCWQRGGNVSLMFNAVGGSNTKAKCATIVFNSKDIVVAKGFGKGNTRNMGPTINIHKTVTKGTNVNNSGL